MPEIFRVENPNSMQGLWYDKDGNFNSKTILTLTDAMAKDMPMDPDPDYGLGGLRWYSGCESIPELSCVFSHSDIIELEGMGYSLFRFEVERYRRNSWHALFTREHVISQEKINLDVLKNELLKQDS